MARPSEAFLFTSRRRGNRVEFRLGQEVIP